jgi:HK97 family phage major capsid protein
MPDTIQQLIEEQGRTFEAFKAKNDQRLAEIEKQGSASAETIEQVNKLNASITDLQERLQKAEIRAARPAAGEGAEQDPAKVAAKAAFFNYMRTGQIDREMRAALVENTTGEILVPEDVVAGVERALPREVIMRQLATVRTTRSDRVRRRLVSDLQVGWGKLETGSSLVESTITPTEAFIYVEDLYGLTKIGEDELMDADPDLEMVVNDSFTDATAQAEDTGFAVGAGHSSQEPTGVFTAAGGVTALAAGQVATIKADDLLALIYAVPAQYRRNGSFLLRSGTELVLRTLKDTAGQYLWQPSLQAGRPNAFLGYPIYNQEDVPAIPTSGTTYANVAAFGDFKRGYLVVDRLSATVKRLNELYAAAGMVGFILHRRVGGGVTTADALRLLKVKFS